MSDSDDDDDIRIAKVLSANTGHIRGNQDLIQNNPIYGYGGGAANTCWFIAALQMLLNTQIYRTWLQTESRMPLKSDSNITKKCYILKNQTKNPFGLLHQI